MIHHHPLHVVEYLSNNSIACAEPLFQPEMKQPGPMGVWCLLSSLRVLIIIALTSFESYSNHQTIRNSAWWQSACLILQAPLIPQWMVAKSCSSWWSIPLYMGLKNHPCGDAGFRNQPQNISTYRTSQYIYIYTILYNIYIYYIYICIIIYIYKLPI